MIVVDTNIASERMRPSPAVVQYGLAVTQCDRLGLPVDRVEVINPWQPEK